MVTSDFWVSQNDWGWKGHRAPARPRRLVAQISVLMALKYLQGWRLCTLSEQSVPVLSYSHSTKCSWCTEETFRLLVHAHCVLSWHWASLWIAWLLSSLHLAFRYLYVFMKSHPSLHFSRMNNHHSWPLLIGELLLSLWHLGGPLLGLFPVHSCLLYWELQDWIQHSRCELTGLIRGAGWPPRTRWQHSS